MEVISGRWSLFQILRDVCTVFRCLVLDDDIRVEFGHAHEHGKLLANAVLIDLTKLLSGMYLGEASLPSV